MVEDESWKPIPFAEKYDISNYGNLRRHINKTHPERRQIVYLKQEITRNGYVRLSINKQHYLCHRLVYLMFVGPLEEGMVVCHIDGDRKNNHTSNLLQATQKENISHKHLHGTWQFGEKHPMAKMTNLQAVMVKKLLNEEKRNPNGRFVSGSIKNVALNLDIPASLVYGLSRKRSGYKNVN